MACLGYEQKGNCDYFELGGYEYYVSAKVCHFNCVSLFARRPALRLPERDDFGVDVSDVSGAVWRCYKWAFLRIMTITMGIATAVAGVLVSIALHRIFIGAIAIAFGVSLLLLWCFPLPHCMIPTASEEAKEQYIKKLRALQLVDENDIFQDEQLDVLAKSVAARNPKGFTRLLTSISSNRDIEGASPSDLTGQEQGSSPLSMHIIPIERTCSCYTNCY